MLWIESDFHDFHLSTMLQFLFAFSSCWLSFCDDHDNDHLREGLDAALTAIIEEAKRTATRGSHR